MVTTRDRIIVATNELFRRFGYNGTSLSRISKASEATIGSIYHFFPGGKQELAVAVIGSTGSVYQQLFEAIVAEAPDVATGFRHVFVGAADVLTETDYIDPCPIGTIAREAANSSEPLRIAADLAFQSWIEAASARLAGAGIPQSEAADLAAVFVATLEGCFVLSRAKRDTGPLLAAGKYVALLADQAIAEAAANLTDDVAGNPADGAS